MPATVSPPPGTDGGGRDFSTLTSGSRDLGTAQAALTSALTETAPWCGLPSGSCHLTPPALNSSVSCLTRSVLPWQDVHVGLVTHSSLVCGLWSCTQ